ncbi:hypothetical protein CN689_05690 [Peribacillus butanolivorans]|uniref:Uncharacterized protein n=1 Tax=Peribacillus butanolivorans TaxID=421767 RepID=A0AAX0S7F0_9BACI|nr:hypothetical protein [Peribacillus butanolivorans]PEJ35949.1 hypothetical protein CN689_05690 [Peribacillus butanolivorans]
MKTYAREVIIMSMLIIILSLIFILMENKIGFSKILDFKTVFNSFATFGGAALGALLAGKYTLKSVNEQKNFQVDRELEQLEVQAIKFHESYRRVFMLLSFYCDLFHGYHDTHIDDLDGFEESAKVKFKEVPRLFNERVEEIRKYSLELKMDKEYEVKLISYLVNLEYLYISLRRWKPGEDERNPELIEKWVEHRIKANNDFSDMNELIQSLKDKLIR